MAVLLSGDIVEVRVDVANRIEEKLKVGWIQPI